MVCQGDIDTYKIFQSDYWAEVKEDKSAYRPLTILLHATICHLAGTNPFTHHLVNVVLHATCTLLVLFFLRRLFANRTQPFLGALLFAIHPTYSEAVIMVSNRSEIVQTCACLVVLMLAERFVFSPHHPSRIYSLAKHALIVLGLMVVQAIGVFSKENASVTPILVASFLIVKLTQGKMTSLHRVRAILAVAFVAIVVLFYIFIRLEVLGNLVRVQAFSFLDNPLASQEMCVRLCSAVSVLGRYILMFFLPLGISGDYSFAQIIPTDSFLDPGFLIGSLLLLVLAGIGTLCLKKRPLTSFGIVWFFVSIFPVSNIPFPIGTVMALRLCYLPYIGLIIATCEGVMAVWPRMTPMLKLLSKGIFVGFVVFFATTAFDYASVLRTNCDFFRETARRSPHSAKALYGFGVCALQEDDLGRAIVAFDQALRIYPDYTDAVIQLAQALEAAGRLEDAVGHLNNFIARHPDDIKSRLALGKLFARNKRFSEARTVFQEILKAHPEHPDAREYLQRLDGM